MYHAETIDVAVIGGGDSAAEDALYLSSICHKVYLICKIKGEQCSPLGL